MSFPLITRRRFAGAATGFCGLLATPVWAQEWPAKPLRIIVPFPPGQAADTIARIIGEGLTTSLGQPVVIENRPGAGGTLGADLTAKAAPDGYTLGMAGNATMSIAPSMYPHLAYAPAKDFTPVARMASVPFVFCVPADSPFKTIGQLVAAAKARPGELTYGSSGNGSTSHLALALFAEMAGIKATHVPYKGSAPSLTDLMGGRLSFSADTTAAVMPHLQSGRLRAIGVSSAKRIPFLPDVPTLDEQGVKGYDAVAWAGLVAPAGTPVAVLNRLNAEIVKITDQPAVRQRFASLAMVPLSDTRDQFAAFLQEDLRQWTAAVKISGAKVE